MQTSSPPVITPNRSQSNPDDMITLTRPIQSVGMDLHNVSGTSTGQTLPRERRAPPGTHFCPTIWWVYPHVLLFLSSTHYCPLFHPLLSEISSSSCKDLARGSAGSKMPGVVTICGWSAAERRPTPGLSCKDLAPGSAGSKTPGVVTICGWSAAGRRPTLARILRPGPQDPRRRNHLRMVRGGAQVCSSSCKDLAPGSAGSQTPGHHLRMVGAQTHTRSAAVTDV